MNTFRLIIATPDGNLFDGQAVSLSVRGAAGDLAVLAGHVPFITSVQPGSCHMVLPDGTTKTAQIDGGILNVGVESTSLLSSKFTFNSVKSS